MGRPQEDDLALALRAELAQKNAIMEQMMAELERKTQETITAHRALEGNLVASERACGSCRHATQDPERDDRIKCSFNPLWIPVVPTHWCGQWAAMGSTVRGEE
jgi:hypothetical protein